jgi:hypothetical protein
MMNKNPYLNNPVARSLFENYNDIIFENEKVDSLLNKISDNALDAFKVLTFDLAPARDRNPDIMRVKLSDISNSKSVKELTAKLLDYADDNDLVNSKYSEAKRLYLQALGKLGDALNRASEIGKGKDEVVLKSFKIAPMKLQNSLDSIAKQAEEELKLKKTNESLLIGDSPLNESIFTGYRGRIENLKKLLANLITSSEGKDQKNGYGRDWKRTFLDLDEKRKVLDTTRGGFGEKDKSALSDLEKQVEKFQDDFNKSVVQAATRSLQNLEDDEEVYTSYSDVTELTNSALDLLTRAKTQYALAAKEIKDEHEAEENNMVKTLFPLKRGDTDADKKIKGSGLIYAIQSALVNGIPSAGKLIKSKGGPNGKYGPATSAVISTIQKMEGNKNTNGELDKTLLDDILSSDWVAEKDKKAIEKSLQVVRVKVNESFSSVMSISDFSNSLNEGKIVINNSEFEKELGTQYKNVAALSPPDSKKGETHESPSKGGSSSGVKALAKSLREVYNLKVEEENFVKQDGSLKSSYSPQFIKAWNSTLDGIKKNSAKEDYSYFFFSGGIYNVNMSSSSLKNPCNWNKWADVRNIKTLGNDDSVDFVENYLKSWKTFGMIRPDARYSGIRSLLNSNAENSDLDLSGAYERMSASIKNKSIPFIDYDNLKGDVAKAFNQALQKGEKSPDLGIEEFVAINNFLVMVSNAISFDGSKFISCVKWIHDNVLGEATAKRISDDKYFTFTTKDTNKDSGKLLGFNGSSIVISNVDKICGRRFDKSGSITDDLVGFKSIIAEGKSGSADARKALGTNCYYIAADIYPSIKTHVKRMNATNFDQVPQFKPFKCANYDGGEAKVSKPSGPLGSR